MGRLVDFNKERFIGRDALVAEQALAPRRRIVGLNLDWPSVEQLYDAVGLPPAAETVASRVAVPVYAKGENVRDWIHVDDHCRGILMALDIGRSGEVYNFGGANEVRNIDLVRKIIDIVGKGSVEFVGDRPGHDFRYAVDFSKAKAELGWVPMVGFEEGLRKTVEWYMRA